MKTEKIKVRLLNYMGTDVTIVNAARVSFDKYHGEFHPETDKKLLEYLAENGHWSPFAHVFLQFRIKAPIFIARQLQKHVVGLAWNEVSRRYVDSEPEFYIPEMRKRAENVKQGSSNEIVSNVEYAFKASVEYQLDAYQHLLDKGVAPEVARAILPQCTMTEWIWSGSLYAFARVVNQRKDSHAQKEAQEVARQIQEHIYGVFPQAARVLIK